MISGKYEQPMAQPMICALTVGKWSYNMTSEQMSELVTDCIEAVRERIIGTGDHQYSNGDVQSIELKSNVDILKDTLEELEDGIVYLAVLRSRLVSLLDKI